MLDGERKDLTVDLAFALHSTEKPGDHPHRKGHIVGVLAVHHI